MSKPFNPITWMRKNQGPLMVGLFLAIIFTFTVGQVMLTYFGNNQTGFDNVEVVSWKEGTLKSSDIAELNVKHRTAIQFINAIIVRARSKNENAQIDQNILLRSASSEEDLLFTQMLAKRAAEIGLVVSDDAISDYLERVSDDNVEPSEHRAILAALELNHKPSLEDVYGQLRIELLALEMGRVAISGIGLDVSGAGQNLMTPLTAWESFQRLNRQIKLDVVPFKVEDFVSKVVRTPTDAELREVYEEYKENFPQIESPDPGFRRREKLAIQYVEAKYADFLEQAEKEITEEQIKTEYESRVARGEFRILETPDTGPFNDPTATEDPADNKTGEEPPGPGTDSVTEEKDPTETPDSTNADDDTTTSSDADPKDDTGAGNSETESDADSVEEPAAGDSSLLDSVGPFFVSAQSEDVADPESDEPDETAKETDDPEEPTEGTGVTDPEGDSADPKGDEDSSPGNFPTKGDEPTADPNKGVEGATPEKIKPLEDVREELIKSLARPIATKMINEVTGNVEELVSLYAKKRSEVSEAELKKMKPLSVEHFVKPGVTIGQTDLVDQLEMNEGYDISSARTFVRDPVRGFSQVSLVQVAFQQSDNLYTTRKFSSPFPSQPDAVYVYWTTEKQEESLPEFEDIREEVVLVWKTLQARELAEAAARELTSKGKSLTETTKNAVATDEFTWMNAPAVPQGNAPPTMTASIKNVESPGPEFMKEAFSLDEGEIGVAANANKSTYYAIEAHEVTDLSALLTRFLKTKPSAAALQIQQGNQTQIIRDWREGFDEEMDVNWIRAPRFYQQ